MYDRSVTVPIERGENTGKTITYSNVVRKLRPIAMWKGEPMSVDLPKSEMSQAKVGALRRAPPDRDAKAACPAPILGAATIDMRLKRSTSTPLDDALADPPTSRTQRACPRDVIAAYPHPAALDQPRRRGPRSAGSSGVSPSRMRASPKRMHRRVLERRAGAAGGRLGRRAP